MDDKTLRAAITGVSKLPAKDLSLLISCFGNRKLKKGELILNEGEVCRSFYLVEKGYLRTYIIKNGDPINLNFTFEGEFTSNLKSLKSRQGSDVSIEAGEGGAVWIFDLEKTPEQLKSPASIALFIRRLAIHLLLKLEEHSNLFKMYTPTERYRYIEKNNPQLLQRISLSQLASYLGVTRETLSRIRAKNQ